MILKRAVSVLLVVCTVACLLCGCIPTKLSEEEALKVGEECYGVAEKVYSGDAYEYEKYEHGLKVKYELDGVYYYQILNFFDLIGESFTSEAILQLKTDRGILLPSETTAYIKAPDDETESDTTLYSHSELTVESIEAREIVFNVTSYYFTSVESRDAGEQATETRTSQFKISLHATEDADGKTVYIWKIDSFTDPF